MTTNDQLGPVPRSPVMAVAVFVLTVCGAVLLLGLAVWPGQIEVTVFGLFRTCLSLPLLGFWFLLLVGFGLSDLYRKREPGVRRPRWGLRSAAVMFATLALLWLHVPQRVGLLFAHTELRELTDTAPVDDVRGSEFDQQVGPYRIDRYEADRRGGVFFRTQTGPDGIGPDQMSYGFALRPNGQGSPFGNAYYRQIHLFGDWYAFAVSDDW